MTGMYGADVAQLRTLAQQFDRKAQQLDANRMTVGNAIQISAWFGPFSVRFRHQWDSNYSRRVHDAAERLRHAANDLRRNADEQDRASTAGAGIATHSSGEKLGKPGVPAPQTTADLYSTLHGMAGGEDGVRVQIIHGADGKDRIVLYINGTFSASGDLFSLWSNFELMTGQENDTLRHVREMLDRAVKAYPDAEIMLAGYSQGGIVAQLLAAEHIYNISTVLTFGSPRLTSGPPLSIPVPLGDIDVVRLEHNGDGIPWTDLEFERSGRNDVMLAEIAKVAGGSDVAYRGGNPLQGGTGLTSYAGLADNPHIDHADYSWLGDQFDKSRRPEDIAAHKGLEKFRGTVIEDVL